MIFPFKTKKFLLPLKSKSILFLHTHLNINHLQYIQTDLRHMKNNLDLTNQEDDTHTAFSFMCGHSFPVTTLLMSAMLIFLPSSSKLGTDFSSPSS